jgi:hypothetical protein
MRPSLPPSLIPVLSPWPLQAGTSARLVNPQEAVRLSGSDGTLASFEYHWDSRNSTGPSCLVASGPYLTVQAGCLSAGGTYAFRLVVSSSEGRTGSRQVRQQLVCDVLDEGPGDVHGSSCSAVLLDTGTCLCQQAAEQRHLHHMAQHRRGPYNPLRVRVPLLPRPRRALAPHLSLLGAAGRAPGPTSQPHQHVGHNGRFICSQLIRNPWIVPPPSLTVESLLTYVIWPARRTSPVEST